MKDRLSGAKGKAREIFRERKRRRLEEDVSPLNPNPNPVSRPVTEVRIDSEIQAPPIDIEETISIPQYEVKAKEEILAIEPSSIPSIPVDEAQPVSATLDPGESVLPRHVSIFVYLNASVI